MLVTNMHVMAGKGANGAIQNPSGDEEMYQGSLTRNDKVGSLPSWDPENPAWLPVPTKQGQTLAADVAMCELEDGVAANFILHDHPNHGNRRIIAGTREPTKGMTLKMLGAATGEHTVTVQAVGLEDDFLGIEFEGVIRLHSSGATADGDSGAPCFYEVREGIYQLACIVFAHNFLRNRTVYAFPASVAEDELGITFGKRAPTATATAPGTVDPGAAVTLDGSGSIDPDGDVLTYRWEQEASVGSGTVELTNADKAVASFTAPNRLAALTFNLTVTDRFGQTATDAVNITIQPNRTPIANAGRDRTVDVGVTVTLDGSGSSDPDTGDTLTYRWEQPAGPRVTLSSPTVASPTFTAPSTATTLTFRLTVSDGEVSNSDTMTVRVVQTTPEEAVRKYDANNNGLIERSEAIKAIQDYLFHNKISRNEVRAIITRHNESVSPSAPADLTATAGNARITLGWSNPDNASITRYEYRLKSGANAWGPWTAIPGSGPATVTYVITGLTNGTAYTAEVRAVNARGNGQSAQIGPVTPSASNRRPTARAGEDQTVNAGASVTLSGSGTDPDGDTLSYSWAQLPGGASVDIQNSTSASTSFIAPSTASTLRFRLTVNDGRGGADTDDVTITVLRPTPPHPANRRPVANAGPNRSVRGGTTNRPGVTQLNVEIFIERAACPAMNLLPTA